MANIKQFTIQINGVQESINAVESLNTQLNALEARINALASKQVNISAKSSNSTGALKEEEKLVKQIQQTEEKIKATRTESYQQLLAEKDLLKEAVNDQKQRAAQERLVAGAYSNTMKGLKEELADIKQVMQTTDLGDDKFKDMVERANQLTTKLKELEQAYGQFGRNVGNYQSAFDGLKKVSINIGGVSREFNSVKEAANTLKQELAALTVAGEGNSQVANEMRQKYNDLKSAMDDATISSKAMDEAMDWMTSFTAMASIGEGFKNFFGLDNSKFTESIKKLASLQSILQGIESIKKQLDAQEGIGGIFKRANKEIDLFVAKITRAEMAEGKLVKTTKAGTVAVRAFTTALKAIGTVAVIGVIMLIAEAISKITDNSAAAEAQVKNLDDSLKSLEDTYKRRNDELLSSFIRGDVSSEDFVIKKLELENDLMEKQIKLIKERQQYGQIDNGLTNYWLWQSGSFGTSIGQRITQGSTFGASDMWGNLKFTVNNLDQLLTQVEKLNDAVNQGKDYIEAYGDEMDNWSYAIPVIGSITRAYDELGVTVELTQEAAEAGSRAAVNHIVADIADLNDAFTTAQEHVISGLTGAGAEMENVRTRINDLISKMNDNSTLHTIIMNLDRYFPDENVRNIIQGWINKLNTLQSALNLDMDMSDYWLQVNLRAAETVDEKYNAELALMKKRQAEEIQQHVYTQEQLDRLTSAHTQEQQDLWDRYYKKRNTTARNANNDLIEAQNELIRMRIQNMEDGLEKQIALLNEERRQKLEKWKGNAELEVEINKYYDKKIEEEKEKHAEKVEKTLTDMWNRIYQLSLSNLKKNVELTSQYDEIQRRNLEKKRDSGFTPQNISSYGVQGKRQLSKGTAYDLQIVSNNDDEFAKRSKQLIDLQRTYQTTLNTLAAARLEYQRTLSKDSKELVATLESVAQKEKEIYEGELQDMKDTYGEQEVIRMQNLLAYESYSTNLSYIYAQRQSAIKEYWQERIALETSAATANYQAQVSAETYGYHLAISEQRRAYDQMLEEANKNKKDQIEVWMTQGYSQVDAEKMFIELIDRITIENETAIQQLTKEHNQRLVELENEKKDKIKETNADMFAAILQEFRDYTTAMNDLENKQPVMNAFGFTNLKETYKNNKNLLDSYQVLAKDILKEKKNLQYKLDHEEISFDDFQNANRELDRFISDLGEKMDEVKQKMSFAAQAQTLIGEISQYAQQLGSALSSMLGAMGDYTDQMFENDINKLEEEIDEYEKLLDKQKDITQEHADALNDIESELSDARGDRRQQLIDALNAEMAAQRASLAEEKRIEKEKERKEQELDDKEEERFNANKKTQRAQAIISGSLAITNALSVNPIWVGLAMAAMTSAMVAYQIAAINAQKYTSKYADGGVIEGNSHAAGGVKVLGGQAEVEGGEFITNKVTTAKNVDLLEYINSKRKKVDISDLLEFYNSGRPSKNISSIRTKFADGGVIPVLRSDIDINDRMLTAFEEYSNRPSYVQVVDIIDRTERLNEVKVISGLEV